ncbi:MAG TPA: preprotein translocase subunit SecY [Bacteroidales bacterium]|jgi:preprotein translocase subunit SecY|nr:preprotein translocase subunit SecY [Bacteroidales bacterium]HQH22880.1 preprotein translocase subunit SecY [Bacteroidales bacterium]HQJ81941.1 preprotein translocase subunit SecY [Bacteroidales bacterium]
MRLIQTIRNIFKIEDLRARLIYTFGIILLYRFGKYITLPGIDPSQLEGLRHQTSSGIMGLLDMFSGGAFSQASIFALGIMPYISASIVVQLLGIVFPYFQKLQKEGESGRRKMNQFTRILTVFILVLQAPTYLVNLHAQLPASAFIMTGVFFQVSSVIILTAGTMFVMWLGERITDKGIGNGISLIIMIGIVARMPANFVFEAGARMNGAGGAVALVVEMVVLFVVILGTVLLVQGTRRVPVQYARRIVGNKQYGGVRQYIPLKVNAAGVMPIIFAQAIMMLPIIIAGYSSNPTSGFVVAFSNMYGFWYNLVTAILIILFTYFYTAVTINPVQMAEDMKKNGGFIPGIKPGRKTVEFFDTIMSRITLPGSIFLAIIAILPAIAVQVGITPQFAQFYGGTSLLILVGVILDTLQQIESHLLMRHYDGLMKSGRVKGRSGAVTSI